MRDRLEEEIADKYDFKTQIRDFEYIRNSLVGDKGNHDLARQHLSVDPAGVLEEIKGEINQLKSKEDLNRLQNQPRLSIDSWEVTESDETVPLTAAESIEKTQTQLLFSISNNNKGNAYNLQTCLYVKPVDELKSPPVEKMQEELCSAEATAKLRRNEREPEKDPMNNLESSESTDFLSNTFISMHGNKKSAFNVAVTGPYPPDTTPSAGFAVGVKLRYDDEFQEKHDKIIFVVINSVPITSLRDVFAN